MLGGDAPSGSATKKARRKGRALDPTTQLSEAVTQTVVKAEGDARSLGAVAPYEWVRKSTRMSLRRRECKLAEEACSLAAT